MQGMKKYVYRKRTKRVGNYIHRFTKVMYIKDFWGRKTPRYNADGSIMKKNDWMENYEK